MKLGRGAVLGAILAAGCATALSAQAVPPWKAHGPLRVTANGHFLEHADGTPFFWLGDTAWTLFDSLAPAETLIYLRDRKAKGFNVIQAVALRWRNGRPNHAGEEPLHGRDPTRPNESYFQHVDWVISQAEALGLYVALLPTWGDNITGGFPDTPILFDAERALHYGRWIGQRYRDRPNVVWVIGGDTHPVWRGKDYTEVFRALARGVTLGVTGGAHHGRVLMTYHPTATESSSRWLHAEPWLDFNMIQSGHSGRWDRDDEYIRADYQRSPAKPVLDAEPAYEDHPISFRLENGRWDAAGIRRRAYGAVLAGAAGHTYGANGIFQFTQPDSEPDLRLDPRVWIEALQLPGAAQMRHLRDLMESRPFTSGVPDQSLVADTASGMEKIIALRGDGFLLAYTPTGRPIPLHLGRISGAHVEAHWYDPRTGEATAAGVFPNHGSRTFSPPAAQPESDWVLVLDDPARRNPVPGR